MAVKRNYTVTVYPGKGYTFKVSAYNEDDASYRAAIEWQSYIDYAATDEENKVFKDVGLIKDIVRLDDYTGKTADDCGISS